MTLSEFADVTGISKRTLSRLETGQRKPSLELLLPIAQAHRSPFDELVGTPQIGDPRIDLKPEKRGNGRVVVPLTRHLAGMRACAANDRPVEILSLLSREGERIHVRARPKRRSDRQ